MFPRRTNDRTCSRLSTLSPLVLVCAVLVGCESPSDRRPISGMVSVDGKPVENGSIMFLPAAGHRGPSASSSISDGAYRFTTENGPSAGPHRVVISVGLLPPSPSSGTGGITAMVEPTAPTSSTSAKQGPANSPSPTARSGEPKPAIVNRTQWDATTNIPAADALEAAEPIDFSFQASIPQASPATDPAP